MVSVVCALIDDRILLVCLALSGYLWPSWAREKHVRILAMARGAMRGGSRVQNLLTGGRILTRGMADQENAKANRKGLIVPIYKEEPKIYVFRPAVK
jgi:hypothetical protein